MHVERSINLLVLSGKWVSNTYLTYLKDWDNNRKLLLIPDMYLDRMI